MARALGPHRCIALPLFHAFTGCDTVSLFSGRDKRIAWDTWNAYENVFPAFCALADRTTLVMSFAALLMSSLQACVASVSVVLHIS